MTVDTETRERIGHLYDYLSALAQEVYAKPVRHVGDHDVAAAPADIPEHPSVRVGAEAGEAWLRVAKTPRPVPPVLPAVLARQAPNVVLDDPYTVPVPPADLADRPPLPADLPASLSANLSMGQDPAALVRAEFAAWVKASWRPWAEAARPAAAARRLYESLFQLRQRVRNDEATHELVWGHGVLGWRFAGQRICHPLLVTRVVIAFDETSGELSVVTDGPPVLELDFLQGIGVPALGELAQIGEVFRNETLDVWSDAETHPAYRRILAPLGPGSRLEEGSDLPDVGANPVVSPTWRLFVRKRRVMFLRFFERLKLSVTDRPVLPAPLVTLSSGHDAAPRALGSSQAEWAPVAERLLMPLATNDEQERIVGQLATHSGVTVQGPPGTGKSHTIANLVCHLVAHGKRVLVTAHKDQALTVLRDKIPAELRDLSLAVLGSSSADLGELQRSVQAITATADGLDEQRESAAVAALTQRLDEVEGQVAGLRERLRSGLEREQRTFELGGHHHAAIDVAHWLARHEAELAAVPDALGLGAEPPVSADELAELYALARRIDARDAAACVQDLPPADRLPSQADLALRHAELVQLGETLAAHRGYSTGLGAIDRLGDAELARLGADCGQAAAWLTGLQDEWLVRLRDQVVLGRQWCELWSGHAQRLGQDARQCAQLRSVIAGTRIELPKGMTDREALGLLEQLHQCFHDGKKISAVRRRQLAQFVRATSIGGERPQTVQDVEKLTAFVQLRRLREALVQLWGEEPVAVLGAPPVPTNMSAVETWIDAQLHTMFNVMDWELTSWPSLRVRITAILAEHVVPDRPTPDELHRLAEVLGALRARTRQRSLMSEMRTLGESLTDAHVRAGAGPLWGDLLDALNDLDWQGWGAALATSARLGTLRADVAGMTQLHDRLATVAPLWARLIRSTGADEARCGDPTRLADLWEWRRAETWLRQIIDADDLGEVAHLLAEAQEEQRRLTLELTRRSAWLAMKRNLGPAERQALVGWLQTLRRIGRGGTARADRWRAEAQRLMPAAMGAVPVWIMPYHRVAESFDPAVVPPFDVVIVDESSQCDVFALGLLGLAHKIVVVGDDKQISPSAVGVNRDRVEELVRAHLRGFPNALLLDLESSLYDASARLFPGVVRLREHFRCLPEIIGFSSRHYYDGEIAPLREEGRDRLPGRCVRAVYVADGMRRSLPIGDVNEAEADALIDTVVQCCADPAYDGRSMGVISLLGSSRQAQYIDERLLHKLGPEEYERRGLRCGDSYGFQGDERDVIFISVVADDGRAAFTTKSYEQRVNVAASRARDQMWVFHSVQPNELHPQDQRAKLIRYATDDRGSTGPATDLESRCESEFERRVLRMLLARGYAVTPQHDVGNLRVDLVVHGGGHRLAVECDGDRYHGPQQWEDDLRRQNVLERLGWRFWRVRGSLFHRDPAAAMAGLWPLLEELGIHPGSSSPG